MMTEHLADFRRVLAEINAESPRGRVMVATAMIDDLLGRTIAARLVDAPEVGKLLEGFNAPLGSFSARVVAAYGLGVISKREFDDLQIIRKIRNDFAHRTGVSFADDSIKDRAMLLTMAAQDYGEVVVNAEGRFTSAAVALVLNLTNRPHYVAQKRLAHEPWRY
jgi:mannitol operon repressor